MILAWILGILMFSGLISWIVGRFNKEAPRWIALAALLANSVLLIVIWIKSMALADLNLNNQWFLEFDREWIPFFGIRFHLAMDGLSLLLLLLTNLLGILSVLISWKEIEHRTGFFHFNILFILAGISGVFLAEDLFLFYFFWEVMLIPMYFLIAIWGHENRVYASYKFFLFTQGGGLLMLLSILGLYFHNAGITGVYTFDIVELVKHSSTSSLAGLFMAGFLIAFGVKIPAIPLHSWLPDAHTEAPTAGSIILAGLLLKTGIYGLIRIVIPLFPDLSLSIAPFAMAIGVAGVLYGAKLAFAQTDLKRLVAYTSISHMGFIIIGIYAFNSIAFRGAVMQIIAHALSTGALFVIAGIVQDRLHTRELKNIGGLWDDMPGLGGFSFVFVMASLGLPSLANFVAEFMILLGTFLSNPLWAILASLGLIVSVIYSLRIMQKVFFGPKLSSYKTHDINLREVVILSALLIPVVYFGIFPRPVFRTLATPVNSGIFLENDRVNSDNSSQNKSYIMKSVNKPLPSLKTKVELNVLPTIGKEDKNEQN
ncbi:MAG: NADH-quinone oxidoreductase subunit M [Dysgonamonadaceae bacterium]|nr:NADH-quinone oxidoreductase subunit M [Dysgonamonadaceae bacterium]MDD3728459.1 NADH-quinone oxidoreductase subunit M [Dysgonamonadaceae bacterium]MDD4245733.1 NADH-quinone oxidoreductase subunit M [Dysgonamonadaceae bacterium]